MKIAKLHLSHFVAHMFVFSSVSKVLWWGETLVSAKVSLVDCCKILWERLTSFVIVCDFTILCIYTSFSFLCSSAVLLFRNHQSHHQKSKFQEWITLVQQQQQEEEKTSKVNARLSIRVVFVKPTETFSNFSRKNNLVLLKWTKIDSTTTRASTNFLK